MTHSINLTQFIIEQQRKSSNNKADFSLLLNDIALACKKISHLVNKGALMGMLGDADSENIQGEVQKKLDIISHEIMEEALNWTGHLSGMLSEEMEHPLQIPSNQPKGSYLALFDPLDGSSNIDLNLTVGSIFSILRYQGDKKKDVAEQDFFQKGSEQVCAGFVLYGPSTMMILTTGQGVDGFTLDPDIGEFILTHPKITIPEETAEFAINMSNQRFWEAPVQRYVEECLQGKSGVRDKDFNMRWIASLVAEVYRVLMRGGIFMYPLDSHKSTSGRLRLLYEANPMSFIVEQAGGVSSTGNEPILGITPTSLHQRVPLILGSKSEVNRVVGYHHTSKN
ncbi:MAG: class 1 fructose-bisphosphatase [Methylococcales bacterium]|nr:class 1 fructose-bisphosphatase [Methylococcales bacterium]